MLHDERFELDSLPCVQNIVVMVSGYITVMYVSICQSVIVLILMMRLLVDSLFHRPTDQKKDNASRSCSHGQIDFVLAIALS